MAQREHPSGITGDLQRDAAENEVRFRSLNQSIRGGAARPAYEFVCECANLRCQRRIMLSYEQYVAVRRNPRHFLICEGHEMTGVETVIERHDADWVVEKHIEVADIVAPN